MLEARSSRAGTYRSQPTGYRAFHPAPLPPDPPLRLSGELQVLLSQADRALGRLDGSVETLPNPDLFVFMYVRKEAVLSSQIEATKSTLDKPWPQAAGNAACFDALDLRDPCGAAAGGARQPAYTGRVTPQPELDRAGGLHLGHGRLRASSTGGTAGSAGGFGEVSA